MERQSVHYHPQMMLRKGNDFTPVCDSVQRGGGQPPGRHPLSQTPPWADTHTPPRQTQPPGQTPLPGQTPARQPLQSTVCILLECILVYTLHKVIDYS